MHYARELLLPGAMGKVLSRASVRSLEQGARNAHNQNKQTLDGGLTLIKLSSQTKCNLIWMNQAYNSKQLWYMYYSFYPIELP